MKIIRKKKTNSPGVKKVFFGKILYAFILMTAFLVILLGIQVSSAGLELSELEKKEKELSNDSKALSQVLTEESSLVSLDLKANNFGFEKPQNIIYIPKSKGFASLR